MKQLLNARVGSQYDRSNESFLDNPLLTSILVSTHLEEWNTAKMLRTDPIHTLQFSLIS